MNSHFVRIFPYIVRNTLTFYENFDVSTKVTCFLLTKRYVLCTAGILNTCTFGLMYICTLYTHIFLCNKQSDNLFVSYIISASIHKTTKVFCFLCTFNVVNTKTWRFFHLSSSNFWHLDNPLFQYTDYGRTMAKSLIFCGPNSNSNPKHLEFGYKGFSFFVEIMVD